MYQEFESKKGDARHASPKESITTKLKSFDNNAALRINAFRMGFNRIILTKRDMNESTLIRVHRGKRNGPMLSNGA